MVLVILQSDGMICESITIRIDTLSEFRCRFHNTNADETSAEPPPYEGLGQVEYAFKGSGDRVIVDIAETTELTLFDETSDEGFGPKQLEALYSHISRELARVSAKNSIDGS